MACESDVRTPCKPFIKWVGGKAKLLPQLEPLLPANISDLRHVESFVGGGAMFFARRPKRALLCDVNVDLVHAYIAVRDAVEVVISILSTMNELHSSAFYYSIRDRYNSSAAEAPSPIRAAWFIYLNKTCFNGLHRVNKAGKFNTPCGKYENPLICDESTLRAASEALQGVEIVHGDFEPTLANVGTGDFVYLDPPYEPASATANFAAYAKSGFNRDDQRRLRATVDGLIARGAKIMLSNSDTPFTRELYSGLRIDSVMAARSVNSSGAGRGKVGEIVVREPEESHV